MIHSKRKTVLSLFLVFALLIGIVGIINVDTTYAATKKIHLKKKTVSVVAGHTYQQKLIDKSGKTIKASKVKWKSSKKAIAKISKTGKITAVKVGTAKMTAKYKGKTYKFTVKVKKPFTSTAKPANLAVIYYENYDEIDISWSKLKNAKKYQVYMSENGGDYSLLVTTGGTDYIYTDYTEGNKYSFQVRGISGNYKSAFSAVKSVTIEPKHNTSISFNTDSVGLMKGGSDTIQVITDKGAAIAYSISNNNVSCKWGSWHGNNCDLTISGNKVGTSIITVYDKNDPSVKAKIEVSVFSYLEMLQYIIDKDGYTNGNGDKTLAYKINAENNAYFIDHGSTIEFVFINTHNTADLESSSLLKMEMQIPEDASTSPEITVVMNDYSFTSHTYVDTADYSKTDELYFYKDSGNIPDKNVQDLSNSLFRLGMSSWDLGLKSLVGFGMNDLGFENY